MGINTTKPEGPNDTASFFWFVFWDEQKNEQIQQQFIAEQLPLHTENKNKLTPFLEIGLPTPLC